MKIILIRHAQSLSNLQEDFSFKTDDKDTLTELGIKQAKLTGIFLKFLWTKESIIISSSSQRAKQTTELITQQINSNIPILFDERLIEKNQDECYEKVAHRASQALNELKENYQQIFCVTHGYVIQSLISNYLQSPEPSCFHSNNCGISIIIDNRLFTFNSVIHLSNKIKIDPSMFHLITGGHLNKAIISKAIKFDIINKKKYIWNVFKLWQLTTNMSVEEVSIQDFNLEKNVWFLQEEAPTFLNIIKHYQRIVDADLSFPIILAPDNEVLDGSHRIAKALILGHSTIKAVRFQYLPTPDLVEDVEDYD